LEDLDLESVDYNIIIEICQKDNFSDMLGVFGKMFFVYIILTWYLNIPHIYKYYSLLMLRICYFIWYYRSNMGQQ